MIAVGGVDDKNLPDFLKAGFIGLGIGSRPYKQEDDRRGQIR